jgi:Ala-tRNA(Pro) deacylase
MATAHVCNVPEDNVAKGVLLRRKEGFMLAIVPASRQLALGELGEWLHEPVGLATEGEVRGVFRDCDPGCVPPVAAAYGLRCVMDDSLEGLEHIYFEGGDHKTLVHMTGRDFRRLMARVPHVDIHSR